MIAVLWSVDGAQLAVSADATCAEHQCIQTAAIRWRNDRLGSRHFLNCSRRRRSAVRRRRPVSKPTVQRVLHVFGSNDNVRDGKHLAW